MRRKLVVILLTAGGLLTLGLVVTKPSGPVGGTATGAKTAMNPHQTAGGVAQRHLDPVGTVDGAVNPEMIPDHAAFSVFFRMLADRQTAEDRHNIRSYVRHVVGLGAQGNCPGCRESVGRGDDDIDALLAAADEFGRRVAVLDNQATDIKDRFWPNPSPDVMAQLGRLQRQKEALALEIAASLPVRFSAAGADRFRLHITDHVKRKVKLIPEPATAPGGPGWQPAANAAPHH